MAFEPIMSLNNVGGAWRKVGAAQTMIKSVPTARDYVQDGLVAMWDGIENVGWGAHDSSTTVWNDLAGTNDMVVGSSGAWHDDCLVSSGAWAAVGQGLTHQVVSVEIVLKCASVGMAARWKTSANTINRYCNAQDGGYSLEDLRRQGMATDIFSRNALSVVYNDVGRDILLRFLNGVAVTGTSAIVSDLSANGAVALGGAAKGEYCALRIYSRALTADEIAANYAIDKARFGIA